MLKTGFRESGVSLSGFMSLSQPSNKSCNCAKSDLKHGAESPGNTESISPSSVHYVNETQEGYSDQTI